VNTWRLIEDYGSFRRKDRQDKSLPAREIHSRFSRVFDNDTMQEQEKKKFHRKSPPLNIYELVGACVNYETRAAERKSYNSLIKRVTAEWKRSEAAVRKKREKEKCRQSRIGARDRERQLEKSRRPHAEARSARAFGNSDSKIQKPKFGSSSD